MTPLASNNCFSPEVDEAYTFSSPLVALESTVLTHGLPVPHNREMALAMEAAVRQEGAVPATIAVLQGKVHVGLTPEEMDELLNARKVRKVSQRDFATVITAREYGGTTVAGTLFVAHEVGIRVFATGGIGGVHPGPGLDISSDLHALAHTPMIVVCAGAKAILDLPATLEVLETNAVPVIGYQTEEFPAFYSPDSGLPVSARLDSPEAVVQFALTHWDLGFNSAVLVTQPPPQDSALPSNTVRDFLSQAQREAREKGVHGQSLTPFLLRRLGELSGGATLKTNMALLLNNAHLAGRIALAWQEQD